MTNKTSEQKKKEEERKRREQNNQLNNSFVYGDTGYLSESSSCDTSSSSYGGSCGFD